MVKISKVSRWLIAGTAMFLLVIWLISKPYSQYRKIFAQSGAECTIRLPSELSDWDYSDEKEKCAIQEFSIVSTGEAGARGRFHLAFLELDEAVNDYHDQTQFSGITKLLAKHENKFVVIFVHGWRHDASIGDENVEQFRTLLAHSRQFLNQRTDKNDKIEVIGIYVGWRGQSVYEPELSKFIGKTLGEYLDSAVSALTFWRRKGLSERHAPLLIRTLEQIDDLIKSSDQPASFNKTLVVGHSFGGNMLLTGLKEKAQVRLRSHIDKSEFQSLTGDLTVLINPAAEAAKWIDIQRTARDVIGIAKNNMRPSSDEWKTKFPVEQRPVLIALTAACRWADGELKSKNGDENEVACDTATGTIFRWGYFWRIFDSAYHKTLGHYDPDYGKNSRFPVNDPFGTTHEVVLNQSTGFETGLSYLGDANRITCATVDGWLDKSRKQGKKQGWSNWDTRFKPKNNSRTLSLLTYTKKDDKDIDNQFRRGLSLPGHYVTDGKKKPAGVGSRLSVAPWNFPFWNVRALNAIEGHNGFVNFPTWCLINQLVLDDASLKD
ncbi:MAG: hypothetical protein ABJM26_20565 [Anderseniella sp.]